EKVKEEKLLKPKQTRILEGELAKMRTPEERQGLQELINNRKLTSRDQDNTLKAVTKIPGLDSAAKGMLENASKAAWHDSPVIRAFRDWIAWLFALGLIGLGMQITGRAIRQAGGTPLVIGSVVGLLKAIGSLLVVLLFISKTV
ncbi:MAG: hypothetical protein HQL95_06480, partial [Magnetococcales bacterium]|nr:hypothetical protein [Magnetococcales bacterium]